MKVEKKKKKEVCNLCVFIHLNWLLTKNKANIFLLSHKSFCILHSFPSQPTLFSLSPLSYLSLKFSSLFQFLWPTIFIFYWALSILINSCSNGFSLEINFKESQNNNCKQIKKLLFFFVVLSLDIVYLSIRVEI